MNLLKKMNLNLLKDVNIFNEFYREMQCVKICTQIVYNLQKLHIISDDRSEN